MLPCAATPHLHPVPLELSVGLDLLVERLDLLKAGQENENRSLLLGVSAQRDHQLLQQITQFLPSLQQLGIRRPSIPFQETVDT